MPEDSGSTTAVRFPFIPLSRAIERAREISKNAGQHPILVADAKKLWGYSEKASGGDQTVSALKQYGLVSDFGAKDRRQLRLSDDARRYFLDERPEVHHELLRKFALLPRAFANLWSHWKTEPPADAIARSTLKVEFGYGENAAAELLTIYKTNLVFAKLADAIDDSRTAGATAPGQQELPVVAPPPPSNVKVGDYVQWTSNGQEQFPTPKRVNAVSDDGSFAQVFGSMTGIPTSELTVTDPPKQPGVHFVGKAADQVRAQQTGHEPELNVLLRGNRLEITADVDRAGLQKLKAVLAKYEEILALLEPNGTA